ncbi:MAG: cysteine methyltransferase [Oleiphilus sp.]|nr:MAG: cysteine methyltransferase [Oleiphilus sp.]
MSESSRDDERHQAILSTLACIPKGTVSTYGQIANQAGYRGQARYVGYILKHLPGTSSIPWHRVVNASGRSSFPENSLKYREQLRLLREESVEIKNGKINLQQYLWLTSLTP